ncbi:acyl-CoA carboxylase epsilon subunit [Streptomyces sp. NPDC059786]|uniref:acyl-CoA carboxylase epsilon subunit n=1 Tax=Streptomyces sp. NPDC059786 TaxID=3346946 RepID=UPI0036543BC7
MTRPDGAAPPAEAPAEAATEAPVDATAEAPVVRVLRGGELAEDELAALTAVLLARTTTPPEAPRDTQVIPLWRRPPAQDTYRPPHSWRD